MRLTKSNVVVVNEELVDCITVWIRHEVTIVPYRGQTLICDARFKVVTGADDLSPDMDGLEGLLDDLRQCFPDWRPTYQAVRGCIKTSEVLPDGMPNPRSVIYKDAATEGYQHGVAGLTVVLPGKASFMWRVAADVTDHILAALT